MTEASTLAQPRRVRNRTSYQITAATPDASVWVSANAGTGKTGVLVDRISRLLLQGVEPEKILCLTFTKAAAAEMANRLTKLLSDWSALTDEEMRAELVALGEQAVDDEKIATAKRLFALTLEAPEGLRIRTIHSFCESLLGRFPLEARVAPDFRVMDERDQQELRQEARDRLLREADGGRTDITDALFELAGLVDEARFATLMKELDSNRGRFSSTIQAHGGTDGLIDAVYRSLGLEPGTSVEEVLREACALDEEAISAIMRLCAAWDAGANTNQNAATAFRDWIALSPAERAPQWRDVFAGAFLTKEGNVRADSSLMSKGALAQDDGALTIAQELAATCQQTLDTLAAANTATATKALIRVGAALIGGYESIKDERGTLDYDDLIERAARLLDSPGGVNWVHFKLDGGIEHVLVDEAQDTSPDQWHVIDQVAADFFSGESRFQEVSDQRRTVFAVGDEKQSIYSFQGAEPAMFGQMRERFATQVQSVDQIWRPVEMAESFRSTPLILNFVDNVFRSPDAAHGLSFDDRPVRHISARAGQAGRIEVWSKEEPLPDDGDDDPWDAPLDHVATDSPEDRVASRIADTIDTWLKTGEMLPAQGRPIQPGDVLILVQKRRRFAELMVAKLKARHIPVSGRDRMILADQIAVKDLIALGRLTLLPEDDLNTATVLKGPLVGLSEDDLFELAYNRKGTVLDALAAKRNDRAAFTHAWAQVSAWRGRADFMPPFEFFSKVLDGDRGRRALLAELGPDAADPIDDFMSAALDFERDHIPSMEGFLHWVQTGASEVKRDLEQGRGEVRVMTVHGAKGLQSEIVFLADACVVPSAQTEDNIHWMPEDQIPLWPAFANNETASLRALKDARRTATLQEYHRLLYVALTRAMDQLYICGFTGMRPPKDTSWYDMCLRVVAEAGEQIDSGDGQTIWRLESAQDAPPDGPAVREVAAQDAAQLPDWATTNPAAEPSPPKPLSPSRPDDEDPPVRAPLGDDNTARFRRGRIIHAVLQTLPDLPADRRDPALRSYLAQPVHDLSATAQNEIATEVLAVLTDPRMGVAFGAGSRAEVPIVGTIMANGVPRVISGQIDRLARMDDEILIVDFKTNRPPPTNVEDVPPVYLRQMAAYRAALHLAFPAMAIRAVLLWTDGPNWMELPEQLLNRHAP